MQNNYKNTFLYLINTPQFGFINVFFKRQKEGAKNSVLSSDTENEQFYFEEMISVAESQADMEGAVSNDNYPFNNNDVILNVVNVKNSFAQPLHDRIFKRVFDILFSMVLMILGLPLFALLYLITKFSSHGPAFFKQERVGKNEKKFYIYKFRSMYMDAEKLGPALSSDADPRITKWGRIIRRTRLDELPQFWNVIKGDMSIVGPRPERSYFIEKIVEVKPDYRKLHLIKPGITSMGQVYYGYAENVDQMCLRMEYDLKYLHSVTLKDDIRLIAKTVKIMFDATGK